MKHFWDIFQEFSYFCLFLLLDISYDNEADFMIEVLDPVGTVYFLPRFWLTTTIPAS